MSSERFNRKAADWDKKQKRRELAGAVMAALAELPLHKDMTVMDFGCGTGLVSLPLASRVGKIIALDTSTGMLDVLRGKVEEQKLNNIETCDQDITAITLPEKFDVIFTSMSLHHISDTDSVLKRFYQLLKPGGIAAIADLDAEDGSFHNPGSGERHHGFERVALENNLTRLGFSSPTFQTVHTLTKTTKDGTQKDFTVFLVTAVKP